MRDILSKLDAIISETELQDLKKYPAAKDPVIAKAIADKEKEQGSDKHTEELDDSFQVGDEFGISFSEDYEISTQIVGFLEDGIVIELDDTAKGMMENQGISFLDGQLEESKKKTLRNSNPCWKGYHPVGTKQKGGRTVPNCVPEAANPAQQAAIAINMKKHGKKPKNESVVNEEEYDYYRDYKAGLISYEEYKDLVRQFQDRERSHRQSQIDQDRGPWYIKIDGKIYKQKGIPKEFDWKRGANNYALAMIKNRPELANKIKLTKKAIDDNQPATEGIFDDDDNPRGHGSAYDRGGADAWYHRRPNPHKYVKNKHSGRDRVELTDPADVKEYMQGYRDADIGPGDGKQYESAPKGWEGTVKAMKKHKDIDNPYALAWSMKNKGYKSHKESTNEEEYDPDKYLTPKQREWRKGKEKLNLKYYPGTWVENTPEGVLVHGEAEGGYSDQDGGEAGGYFEFVGNLNTNKIKELDYDDYNENNNSYADSDAMAEIVQDCLDDVRNEYGSTWKEIMYELHGDSEMEEAQYHGHEVPLGKKMAGDVKKSKVYVRDPKTGNIKKINFGDKKMRIKKYNPARRKSFRARHHCSNPGPRTKARYWSCRSW